MPEDKDQGHNFSYFGWQVFDYCRTQKYLRYCILLSFSDNLKIIATKMTSCHCEVLRISRSVDYVA